MKRLFIRTLVGAVSLLSVACASQPYDGRVFRSGALAFRIGPVPDGWRPIEASEALLAFRDDDGRATIAVNGRCGADGDDVPLEALTKHLFLQFTQRQLQSQGRVEMDGREALRTDMVAALDGVAKRYTVYVLKKDGCVYDFLRIADGAGEPKESSFERFVQSFSTLDEAG
jgi:hypothetical protein